MKRFALSVMCTIVLVVSACTDATRPPTAPDDLDPSFSHGGPSETTCPGFLSGTHDNVTVPPGQGCFIVGATILGNLKMLQDAFVNVLTTTVHGNVEGDGPEFFQMTGGTVDGNIFITEAGIIPLCGGPVTVFLSGVTVTGGDVHILKSTGNLIQIADVTMGTGSMIVEDNTNACGVQIFNNDVAQNLQVFKNLTVGFAHVVFLNFVGQNLQCFENSQPFIGAPNFAEQAEGQCFAGTAAAATGTSLLDNEDLLEQQGLQLTTDERGVVLVETAR